MTRSISTLTALLLLSCANPSKTGPATGASVASAPAPASPTPAPIVPDLPATTPPPALATASAATPLGSALAAVDSAPSGATPEAPATGSAALETQVEGCLAAADPPPEAQTRSFVPRPDRVEVNAAADSVTVAHHLSHACCLKSQTALERAGSSVTVVERLTGTPCRCRCASVIRSRIALAPGDYELAVRIEEPGGTRAVHRGRVKVGAEAPAGPAGPKLPEKIKVDLKPKQ